MKLSAAEIKKAYRSAKEFFEKQHPEWICTITQSSLVIQLNWQNAKYFSGKNISHSDKNFRHIIKLRPDGSFVQTDMEIEDETSIGLGSLDLARTINKGEVYRYTDEYMAGKDNETGKTGALHYCLDTDSIKEPVCEYFEGMGFSFYSPTRHKVGMIFLLEGMFFIVMLFIIASTLPEEASNPEAFFPFLFGIMLIGMILLASSHIRLNTTQAVSGIFATVFLVLALGFAGLCSAGLFPVFIPIMLTALGIIPIVILAKSIVRTNKGKGKKHE